jgi:hypothetical protein
VSEEYLLGCSLRQRLKQVVAHATNKGRTKASTGGTAATATRYQAAAGVERYGVDRGKTGGAPPQPTIEQMMRGGPVKGVAVSADTLRAQRRVGEVTGGSVEKPWVADSSEEEDGWEAYVENGVITQ